MTEKHTPPTKTPSAFSLADLAAPITARLPVPARRFTGRSQMRFLAHGVRLEEAGPPKLALIACCAGFLALFGAIVAASMIKLSVWSMASGRIMPTRVIELVQTSEGGIVDRIFVDAFQPVKAGQILVSLRHPEAEAALAQLHDRRQTLEAKADRLRHQALAGKPIATATSSVDALSIQGAMLHLNDATRAAQAAVTRAEIDRHATTLLAQQDALEAKTREISLFADELARKKALLAQGLIAASDISALERGMREREAEAAGFEGQIRTARASMVEAERRLDGLLASEREDQGDELAATLAELQDVEQLGRAAAAKVGRGLLTAAADGVVNDLHVRNPGHVLAPGDIVAELTPTDSPLIAEVQIEPADIGHVALGQRVRLAVDGLDPHRFGYLEGKLRLLSPDTFEDEQGIQHYKGKVELGADQVGADNNTKAILPGMIVTAQIETGSRTIMAYLLKPLDRVLSGAMNEQ